MNELLLQQFCVCVVCLFLGYTKLPFKWFDYLRETGSVAAPVKLFNKVSGHAAYPQHAGAALVHGNGSAVPRRPSED